MSFTTFITKRFVLSRKESRFINFISTVSIVGVTLGVTALIITLSILNGFEQTITNKITDFDSHIQITSYIDILSGNQYNFNKIKNLSGNSLENISPYASRLAIISNKKLKEGVTVKGITGGAQAERLKKNIVNGKFDLTADSSSIIIGKKLADKLRLKLGDRVTVFSLRNNEIPSPENLPNIEKFKVTAIFESGMAQYDDIFVYVSLKKAQALFEIGENITGYDLKLKDINKVDSLTEYLSSKLRYPYAVRSIFQIHRNIFTWIQLQQEPIPIILGLITLVAVFNIIGTLLMIVLEKTNEVGILKSLGAKRRQIIFIFLMQGGFLSIIGIAAGNILAFILTFLQLKFNIISLPSSVYFMNTVPISLSYEVFAGVSLLTLILSLVASFIPSYIASRIVPIESLRFS